MNWEFEDSGTAKYIFGKMHEAIGEHAHLAKQIEWLEGNALGMWEGDKDLELGTIADTLFATVKLVVPGKETKAAHPECEEYGVHVRKTINNGYQDLRAEPKLLFRHPVEFDAPLNSPIYEDQIGREIGKRVDPSVLPYHRNLGADEDTIRTRAIPGPNLLSILPRRIAEGLTVSEIEPTIGERVEGLSFYEKLKEAVSCVGELNESGVAHRDVDLRNFILTPKGVTPMDFAGSTVTSQEMTEEQLFYLNQRENVTMLQRIADVQVYATGVIEEPLAQQALEFMQKTHPEKTRYRNLPTFDFPGFDREELVKQWDMFTAPDEKALEMAFSLDPEFSKEMEEIEKEMDPEMSIDWGD